jgi:hypothetical protein
MRLLVPALLCALVAPAFADPLPTVIETHGIEIEVPTGWSVTNKGASTTIMPTKYKGRGIEIVEIAKPLTKELITEFMTAAKMENAKVGDGERDGNKIVAGTGTLDVKGKGKVDVDLLAVPNAKHNTTIMMSFIKGDSDPVLRKANDALLLSARLSGPKISLAVTKPAKKGLSGLPDELAASIGAKGTGLDGVFRFPRPLPIKVKECGVVNCFYSPSDHSITVCHEFWDDTLALFKKTGADDAKATELARGAVMFAFFHEFGHALVGEFGLPITGKGEDAADEIATIILGQAKEFGRKSAMAGAAWFAAMMADPNHHNIFWDEHSFDEQRVVSIMCLLYGSDQKQYEPAMESLKIPKSRLARCVRDYKDRFTAWNKLLDPHARHEQKKPEK